MGKWWLDWSVITQSTSETNIDSHKTLRLWLIELGRLSKAQLVLVAVARRPISFCSPGRSSPLVRFVARWEKSLVVRILSIQHCQGNFRFYLPFQIVETFFEMKTRYRYTKWKKKGYGTIFSGLLVEMERTWPGCS